MTGRIGAKPRRPLDDRAVGRGEELGEVQVVLLFRPVRWVWPGMSCRLAWCGNGVRKRAEARDVVPYAFEGLVVIGTRA